MELINSIDETFKFENKEIRVIGSYQEPWFVAKDICDILELSNITNALKNIPEKWMSLKLLRSSYNSQNMNIISEAAVYKLIMRSNKPIAQKFQEVVCEDILPNLRKKGEYKIQSIIDKNKELEEEKLRIDEENKRLEEEKKINEMRIKHLENKVLTKQKRTQYEDRNYIYIIQDEYHKKDRIFVMGKAIILEDRLASYNKTRDHDVIYCRSCNSAQQMNYIEKCVLSKLDKYREVANRDRFILPKDKDISLFTDVADLFIDAFNDVDPEVDVESNFSKEEKKEDTKYAYQEDNKEYIAETNKIYREEHKDELFVKAYEYCESNKETLSERASEHREENIEQIKYFQQIQSEKNGEEEEKYKDEYRKKNKEVLNELNRKYYEQNKEKHLENCKKYREDHKEEMTEYNKKYYEEHKEEFAKYKKEQYENNKDSIISRSKEYYEEHKEDVLERTKKHYSENKDKILEYQATKITCECGMTIQRNYSSKHKRSEIHKVSLEHKLNGNPPTTKIKVECECGQIITKNYTKRHLKSAMHAIALRLKLEKQNVKVEENDEI